MISGLPHLPDIPLSSAISILGGVGSDPTELYYYDIIGMHLHLLYKASKTSTDLTNERHLAYPYSQSFQCIQIVPNDV
uniref:Uncharacterized protein n=1 Tax=Picea glauca TaxID=3330 RepID=A0A101LYJ4_PICGL|nr:hypothetical protein ABT39_MTgene5896 [Picea glauca]QHR92079.1 hypothetical protein Q903MT_gene6115 [Picea sitchensis]